MANDSEAIPAHIGLQPCDTPRGCTYYTGILTDCQQMKLNQLKLATIKSSQKYLRTHPEIRGFISLISRYIFKQQPRRDIPQMIREFFNRPQSIIDNELDTYLKSLPEVEYDNEYAEEEEEEEEEGAFNPRKLEEYLQSMPQTEEEQSSLAPHKDQESRAQIESFVHELLESKIAEIVPSTSVVDIKEVTEETQSDKSIKIKCEDNNTSKYNVRSSIRHSNSTTRVSIMSETSNDRVLAMKIASKIKQRSRGISVIENVNDDDRKKEEKKVYVSNEILEEE